MEGESAKRNRHSIRLKQYDYYKPGYYFITICTQGRKCLLGNVENEKMIFNDAGEVIVKTWKEIPCFYNGVGIDEFQTMPNHFHGIVVLKSVGATSRGCLELFSSVNSVSVGVTPRGYPVKGQPSEEGQPRGVAVGQPRGVAPTKNRLSLPDVVHRFKSLTTTRYSQGVKSGQWGPFNRQFWQRNYYEHVIRDENELLQIREYIVNNPKQWSLDRENPEFSIVLIPKNSSKGHQPWQV